MQKRKWIEPFLNEEKTYLLQNALDYKDIYLEIGMGMGDFIVESCLKYPDRFYIGLEKNSTCCARAIKKAQENNISNLKIMHLDASKLLESFSLNSINTIYLHFSDPWPKKAHHKRRLTYKTFLDLYYQILMNNGHIIFKTDNDLLFEDSLQYFKDSKFIIEEVDDDYHHIKRDEPLTGYERKFKDLGNPIHYVRLIKA